MFCDRNVWLFTLDVFLPDAPLRVVDWLNCCERLELPLLPLENWRLLLPLLLEAVERLRLPPDDEFDVKLRLLLLEERTLAELRLLLLDDRVLAKLRLLLPDERKLGLELRETDARLPPPSPLRRPCAAASSIVAK